ncbi:MAG: hypothetical protein P4L34_12735 [Paludibacter sp.]|nr:hypothetical protein [Paludibacter sp.]
MNKIKILSWTVVVLIVLNLTTIGTILYHNYRESTDKVVEINVERKNMINGKFFRQTLGFNQNQMQVFREANHEFRPKANKIIFSIDSLKNEMFTELKKAKSDTIRLNFLSRETGNLHAELKRETNRFYLKIKMVCTPEQLNKLQMDFSPLYKSESYNGDGRGHKGNGNGNRNGNGFRNQ